MAADEAAEEASGEAAEGAAGSAAGRGGKKRGVGRPRRIEPEAIAAAARRILREEGLAGLSMRRVAKEVGTTPMALYHHVRDKDDLLMLTLSGTADTLPRPDLPADPRERLLAVSLHMHATLLRMPWVVEVLGLGDLTDRGALWMVEEIVGICVGHGMSQAEAVRAYRTIWHCVYGDLAFRRAMERRAADPERRRHFPDLLTDADAAELPHLAALADRWTELTEDYDASGQLGAVIDGLLARTARPEPSGGM
ncbi:TetR/AcrR family transcriptional regulator [Streptomyces luteocolor]|uniref:TetR/AcrR family transcriptional regulator n=1 Tax=Streptomyces luteocolor TaxID=285500 RepID=UPI003F766D84